MVSTGGKLARLYLEALRAGDASRAYRIAQRALDEGTEVPALYQRIIAPAMQEIGALWATGALTIADEHRATELTNRVLAALRPPLGAVVEGGIAPQGRALLAAVEGERHALGLRMASDILEDSGLDAIYLGADVPTRALLQAIDITAPDLVVLAATMPSLAPRLEDAVDAVRRADPRVEVLVGGQAASPRIAGGTLVQSFELLPERVLLRSQV